MLPENDLGVGDILINQKVKRDTYFEHIIFNDTNDVSSVTECTGLIQIPPINEEEAKAYCDIYAIPIQINHSLKKYRKEQ